MKSLGVKSNIYVPYYTDYWNRAHNAGSICYNFSLHYISEWSYIL